MRKFLRQSRQNDLQKVNKVPLLLLPSFLPLETGFAMLPRLVSNSQVSHDRVMGLLMEQELQACLADYCAQNSPSLTLPALSFRSWARERLEPFTALVQSVTGIKTSMSDPVTGSVVPL